MDSELALRAPRNDEQANDEGIDALTSAVIPGRDDVASFDAQLRIRESIGRQCQWRNGFRARAARAPE